MSEASICIDGKENKDDYNIRINELFNIIKENKNPYMILGAIELGNKKMETFAANNGTIPHLMLFLFKIKEVEKQVMKQIIDKMK